jgi:hypothetical protein
MRDEVLQTFRDIHNQMLAANGINPADRTWNWFGPRYFHTDLTREQAEAKMQRFGGYIKSDQQIAAEWEARKETVR